MKFDIWFMLLCISLILIIILGIYLLRMRNKKQIHFAFLSLILTIFIWSFGNFLIALSNNSNIYYVYFYFWGVCFIPVSFLFFGLLFAYTRIDFNWKYKLLFVFPIIDYLIIITNQYHHLFFVKYSSINALTEYGKFYFTHTIISYIYIFSGIFYLLYYSIKNAGFFSRQSILILLGACIPLVFNIFENFQIFLLPVYITPVAFSFTIICFAYAILKFDFLNVMPVALQRIVDLISDSYIVINEDLEIIDYNKPFIDIFQSILSIKRKDYLVDILSNSEIQMDQGRVIDLTREALENKKSISFEQHIIGKEFDKYFIIEITPILSNDNHLGTIILFKDVSEHKKNIEIIKRNQEILMEQERMASLGQMIGGIAHNLNTPIMSLAGGIEALKDLAHEYKESVQDENVTAEDHYEIADEMLNWLEKMKPYCSYMTDLIGAVKGQAVQMNYSKYDKFTIEELVKRIDVLMKHELKKYHCILKTDFNIDMNTEIKGQLNGLVQVVDNIIMNAIQAYDGEAGEIVFKMIKEGDNVELTLRDYGKGMTEELQKKLFKEMLTTKGKNGTGLGLYMSYSTVRGRFSGNMRFESMEGKGTTFYITIPCFNSEKQQEEEK